MTTLQIPLPDEVFTSVRKSPQEIARDMRLAVAIRWYAQGLISQGTGAEIAGLSRAEFLRALSDAGVSPFQETLEEIREAARGGAELRSREVARSESSALGNSSWICALPRFG